MTTPSTPHQPKGQKQPSFRLHSTQQIYSTKEAARLLSVSHRTLEDWRGRGGGPRFFTMGRLVRYRLDDLDRFVSRDDFGNTGEAQAA